MVSIVYSKTTVPFFLSRLMPGFAYRVLFWKSSFHVCIIFILILFTSYSCYGELLLFSISIFNFKAFLKVNKKGTSLKGFMKLAFSKKKRSILSAYQRESIPVRCRGMLYVLLPLQREIILVSINFLQVCVTSTFRVHKPLIKYQVSISTVAAICVIYYFFFFTWVSVLPFNWRLL